jgi:phospholipid/cholesterol/gamma-HCH transport system permease protein
MPRTATRLFDYTGGAAQLGAGALASLVRGRLWLADVFEQLDVIGRRSLSVAILTAVFSSMVMTVQFAVQLARFGARERVASVVSLSLVRELGPVLTALIVGGRVGAGIAAELGAMAVSEQVDAMRAMGANPVERLVTPRVLACVVSLPLLTVVADVLGIAGALGIARLDRSVSASLFYNEVIHTVGIADFASGLIKSGVFGLVIALIACSEGLNARGGTAGVGRATTRAVVIASLTTLGLDFVLTRLMIGFGL